MAEAINSVNSECHDLISLLSSEGRDFLVGNNGDQVKIKDLSGKIVGLFFSASWCPPCRGFTPSLVEVYEDLCPKGDFEVVLIPSDKEEEAFNGYFSKMPWLAIPFHDSASIKSVKEKFGVRGIPHLIIFDGAGKVLTNQGVEMVMEYGKEAYPFTPERINQLIESQTLGSLLVSGEKDYVIDKSGSQVPVSQLTGKHVLIYFSAHWCPPCRDFTPKLIQTYDQIKAKENAFEVIFVSSDRDQPSFDKYYSSMPWLAIPLGDTRKAFLTRRFRVRGIPCLVGIGPDGKTVTTKARQLIESYGADAFPFTEEHILNLKEKLEKMSQGWPEKLKLELHDHELVKVRRGDYVCDGCENPGQGWSFYCDACEFGVHPECALKNPEKAEGDDSKVETGGGFICEGGVCRRQP